MASKRDCTKQMQWGIAMMRSLMPSPVGHALGAIAAGWTVADPATPRRARVWQMTLLAGIGIAADLDLLIGRHSKETHSIGAAVIAAGVAALFRVPIASSRGRIFTAAFVAWLSHPLPDMMGDDSSPPFGVMTFWPFSTAHCAASLSVDLPVARTGLHRAQPARHRN